MSRPRPVVIYGTVMAVLAVVNESADAADILPEQVFPWLRLGIAVATAIGGALWTQTKVTPLSDPQTNDGVPLVPRRTVR